MRVILFALLTLTNLLLIAQDGGVKGFVFDQESGEPIIFTNVYLEGTTIGSNTDINGFYAITKVPEGKYTLVCSYLGYDTVKTSVQIGQSGIQTHNLFMKESTIMMSTVQIDGAKQKAQTQVQISNLKISTDDINKVPSIGGQADLAQYMQVVPGVVFSGEQGGQLYIRGGAPIQNKILLDGMTIYNPFHSMGVFSVFETDIIKNVDILTGGFNSQYGGRLSAVVDIHTKDGSKNRLAGKASINPFATKLIVEGPLKKFDKQTGTSVSYIITGKQSLIDASGQALYDNLVDSLPYGFTDFYGKLSINGKNGSALKFFGFNFSDGVNFQNSQLGWTTYGTGMKYIVTTNKAVKIDGDVTYSDYSTELVENGLVNRRSNINGFGFKMQFTQYLQNDEEFKYGFDVTGESMAYYFRNPYNITLDVQNQTTDFAGYAKYKMKREKSIWDLGLRMQYYGKLSTSSWEPRVGYKLNANDNLRFKFAGGRYTQSLIAAVSDRDVINLFSGFLFAPQEQLERIDGTKARNKLQSAWHAIAGVEKDIGDFWEVNFEGYYKLYTQLININREKTSNADSDYMIEEGDAYGLDLLIKYDKKGTKIWSTYSLSFVTREDASITYFTNFDRRHNLNFVLSREFGKERNWEFSGKWNLGSGFPFTQIVNYYPNNTFDGGITQDYINSGSELGLIYDDLNAGRLPYFHRLDLSLKRTFIIGKDANGKLETSFTVTNAYNRANIFYYDPVNNERVDQLPLLPSLGVNLVF